MAKVSVIIPARNEPYLIPTIDNLFAQARGEVEVVAVIEDAASCMPDNWAEVQARHPNLHTILHNTAKGMRPAINAGVASAISRGTKYVAKFDAHCTFGEGWDEILKADCDDDWIIVPRRKRLDVESFAPRTDGRPDIDYHYLSFPDNVNDFGGPGLNGKVWDQRARERLNQPEYEIDDEMSSQGSGWFMHAAYFQRMGFMDHVSYGPFWNEFQELGLSCWLSGGQVKVNKRTWYAHWHKGSAGRGYHLPKDWLNTGATFTKRWLFNNASDKQTRPFSWLIEHFWPVPTWPENWEELVYGSKDGGQMSIVPTYDSRTINNPATELVIHSAHYGIDAQQQIDVTEVLRRKVVNGSLDLNVTNAELEVGNPYRGFKKTLMVTYSYNGDEPVTVTKEERDWLIIGQSARYVKAVGSKEIAELVRDRETMQQPPPAPQQVLQPTSTTQMIAPALNDLLIRKFAIPTHRLRGPMPIELPHFHRNDLAQLFAELGFQHGAEIGVAEGNYSEVLMRANPNLHLLLVDPWHHYSGNPQGKSKEKNEYAYNEAKRKVGHYPNVQFIPKLSMDAVRDVPDHSLDFVYVDGHHGFPFVMMDTIMWMGKLRSGGIMAGDDYYYLDPKRWGAGPVQAIQAYTTAMGINPWFICNAHKSVDYFWVKV